MLSNEQENYVPLDKSTNECGLMSTASVCYFSVTPQLTVDNACDYVTTRNGLLQNDHLQLQTPSPGDLTVEQGDTCQPITN